MTINKIQVENIKGISARSFELDILANRPSLLVAPNGFGKSSLAISFLSLQANKLSVHDDNSHRSDTNLSSKLIIEYTDTENTTHTLEANDTLNQISEHFDCFVINNQIKAKGVGRNFGGRTTVSASIAVEPVTLIETIPSQEVFEYSYQTQKQDFGKNGKVLPNITTYFNDNKFIKILGENFSTLDRISQVRPQNTINDVIASLNDEVGTKDELRLWLINNRLAELEAVGPLNEISELILNSNLGVTTKDVSFLAAIQLHNVYALDKVKFKKAYKYSNYKLEKFEYAEMLKAFNSSWRSILPKEKGRKLVVEFPKANHISNGQRDVITFVALLYRAQNKLKRNNSILIIDEVFDYLDDANLVAVQYYITKLIDKYKKENRRLYPLILTHLNPYYFKNFAFSKQKIYYLDKREITPNAAMVKLLRNRERETIKDDVSKYLLHYHSGQINKRAEFQALNLRETWGEGNHFETFINNEIQKYLQDGEEFDPLSVCCAVRRKVEHLAYIQLIDANQQQAFLDIHKTRVKLAYAERIGAVIPEYFYLLGVIYNDGMHWREGQDNISPIAAKLENNTIKKLIGEVFH